MAGQGTHHSGSSSWVDPMDCERNERHSSSGPGVSRGADKVDLLEEPAKKNSGISYLTQKISSEYLQYQIYCSIKICTEYL